MRRHTAPIAPSSDAAAFAAASQSMIAAEQDQAFQLAGQAFVDANAEITGNIKGGAGYFAEVHHTASFNIEADRLGQEVEADRLDSHAYGSVDIATPDGGAFNPKYYATAEGGYQAGMELTAEGAAKYAGQTIIVPPEQLAQVQAMHAADLQAAIQADDQPHIAALQSVQFSDHVVGANGVGSLPLSYSEAQQGAEAMRQGVLPVWTGEPMSMPVEVLEGALISGGLYAGVQLAPALFRLAVDVADGRLEKAAAAQQAKEVFRGLVSNNMGQALARGGSAAAVVGLDVLDPTGAAFVVNVLADTLQLAGAMQRGELAASDFSQRLKLAILDRGLFTGLTAGAVWVVGPLGLLVPIGLRLWLNDKALQGAALKAWQALYQNLHDDLARAFTAHEERYQLCLAQLGTPGPSQSKSSVQLRLGLLKDISLFQGGDEEGTVTSAVGDVPMALEEVQLANTAMLSAMEQQRLDEAVVVFVEQNQHNRQLIEASAMAAMQALAPVAGNAISQRNSGVMARLWGMVGGKTMQLSASNDYSLAQGQYAALRLMNALQQKACLALEFSAVLQNRIDAMQQQLKQQGLQQQTDLRRLFHAMSAAFGQVHQKLLEQQSRLDNHERRLNIQDWLLHPDQPRKGRALHSLPPAFRLACLVSEFYQLTDGCWSTKELFSLQQMLIKVGLSEDQPILMDRFCADLASSRGQDSLLSGLAHIASETSSKDIPAAQRWLVASHYRTLPAQDGQSVLEAWGYAGTQRLSPFNLAIDLLYQLQAAGFSPSGRPSVLQQQKHHWRLQLAQLDQLVADKLLPPAFAGQIAALQSRVAAFRLLVPLIGKFSVGKSTLLNAWLGQDIQAQDLAACTAVPTEFHYAQPAEEKVVVYRDVGTGALARQEYPLSSYPALLNGEMIHHIEIHRNLAALSLYPDIILVDTPGLESTQGRHDRALGMYIGEGVAFILCVTRSGLGEAEKTFLTRQQSLGQDVLLLVCQEDLSAASQRPSIRQAIAEQLGLEPAHVRGCSSRNRDLSGFADLLQVLEQHKLGMFSRYFAADVQSLVQSGENLLEAQLAYDGDIVPLQQQAAKIRSGQQELQRQYERERGRLIAVCAGDLPDRICQTMTAYLYERQGEYQALAKNRPEALEAAMISEMQNAFQLALRQQMEPPLHESAQRLGMALTTSLQQGLAIASEQMPAQKAETVSPRQMGWLAKAGLGGILATDLATGGFGTGSLMAGLGTVALPVAAVAGAGAWLFVRARDDKRHRELVQQATDTLILEARRQMPERIQARVEQVLAEIYTDMQRRLEITTQQLEQIDAQMRAGTEARHQLRLRAQSSLAAVRALLAKDGVLSGTGDQ